MDWLVVCMFVGSFVCVLGSKYHNMASRNPATSDESQPCHNWRVATLPQVASCNPATICESQPCMLWLFLSCMCCNLPLCSSSLLAAAAGSTLQHMLRWRPSGQRRDPCPLCALSMQLIIRGRCAGWCELRVAVTDRSARRTGRKR